MDRDPLIRQIVREFLKPLFMSRPHTVFDAIVTEKDHPNTPTLSPQYNMLWLGNTSDNCSEMSARPKHEYRDFPMSIIFSTKHGSTGIAPVV